MPSIFPAAGWGSVLSQPQETEAYSPSKWFTTYSNICMLSISSQLSCSCKVYMCRTTEARMKKYKPHTLSSQP